MQTKNQNPAQNERVPLLFGDRARILDIRYSKSKEQVANSKGRQETLVVV